MFIPPGIGARRYIPFRNDYALTERISGRYLVTVEYPNVLYFTIKKDYMFPLVTPKENEPLTILVEAEGHLVGYTPFDDTKFVIQQVSEIYHNFDCYVLAGFKKGAPVSPPQNKYPYTFTYKLS